MLFLFILKFMFYEGNDHKLAGKLKMFWEDNTVEPPPPPPAILICKNNKLSFVYQPADGHNKERRPEESTEKSLSLSLSLSLQHVS